jgi:general secretion pathway protein H
MVTLGFIALALTLALPRLTRDSRSLEASGQQLMVAAKTARAAAILQRRTMVLRLDPATRGVSLGDRTASIGLPTSASVTFNAVGSQFSRGADPALAFFADGTSSGGLFTLADRAQVVTVNVDWISGAAVLRRLR